MLSGINTFPNADELQHPIIQFEEERLAVLDRAGEVRVAVHRKNNITLPCSVGELSEGVPTHTHVHTQISKSHARHSKPLTPNPQSPIPNPQSPIPNPQTR